MYIHTHTSVKVLQEMCVRNIWSEIEAVIDWRFSTAVALKSHRFFTWSTEFERGEDFQWKAIAQHFHGMLLLGWKPLVSICICGMSIGWTLPESLHWNCICSGPWLVYLHYSNTIQIITSFFYICEIILKKWVSINHRQSVCFWCWFLLVRSSSYLTFQVS